jgi:hypothetical protein
MMIYLMWAPGEQRLPYGICRQLLRGNVDLYLVRAITEKTGNLDARATEHSGV